MMNDNAASDESMHERHSFQPGHTPQYDDTAAEQSPAQRASFKMHELFYDNGVELIRRTDPSRATVAYGISTTQLNKTRVVLAASSLCVPL